MYLVDERQSEQSYSLFFDRTKTGAKGLCILRRQPDDVALRIELKNVKCHWLLLRETKDSIRPSDLRKIDEVICSFLERNRGGIVLLDGFETLLLFNDFTEVSELLSKVRSLAESNEGAVIVPVDSRAMFREDFNKISESFRVLELDSAEKPQKPD
jgi:archaellum biogenesis ATPase FlaH